MKKQSNNMRLRIIPASTLAALLPLLALASCLRDADLRRDAGGGDDSGRPTVLSFRPTMGGHGASRAAAHDDTYDEIYEEFKKFFGGDARGEDIFTAPDGSDHPDGWGRAEDRRIEQFRVLVFHGEGDSRGDLVEYEGELANRLIAWDGDDEDQLPLEFELPTGLYDFAFVANDHGLFGLTESDTNCADLDEFREAMFTLHTGDVVGHIHGEKAIPMVTWFAGVQVGTGSISFTDTDGLYGVKDAGKTFSDIWSVPMQRAAIRLSLGIHMGGEHYEAWVAHHQGRTPLLYIDGLPGAAYAWPAHTYPATHNGDHILGTQEIAASENFTDAIRAGKIMKVADGYEIFFDRLIYPEHLPADPTDPQTALKARMRFEYATGTVEREIAIHAPLDPDVPSSADYSLPRNLWVWTRAALITDIEYTTRLVPWGDGALGGSDIRQWHLKSDPSELLFRSRAATRRIDISTDWPEGWYIEEILPGEDWITLSDDYGPAGESLITVSVAQNDGEAVRVGRIVIRAGNMSKTIVVTQLPASDAVRDSEAPSAVRMYVGAFWRADQYGERLIRVNRPPSNDAIDGDWAAYVLEGEDWIVLDTAPSTDAGVGTESPAADGNDPDFDERHRVRGFRTSVSGSVAATPTTSRPDNRIWFRIGLNGPYTPTIDAPARYGMILLVYGGTENPKYRIIRIRQGEGDDYLILPSNVEEEARGIIRKVSPYNLSAPGFSALTGEPWVNLDFHGGDWTDYPTQAGAFFQWQNPRQGYGRRAWHPGQSGGPSYDTPVNAAPWNPDLYEACPVGYRRPDASMGTRAGAQAYHNELTRSLNIRSESEQDMVRGLYADGFFDRRYQGSTQTRVATSTWQTASGGTLFYDSGPRGASIFLPDAGRLGHNTTDYEGSLSTSSGNYWVGATPSYQLPNYLYLSSNARMYYLDNFYSFSIRCVVDPSGPRSVFSVPERVEFVYSGETLPVEITSHRADGFALGWEVAGYDADNDGIFSKNEKPAWLTMPASDAGSTPVHSVDITVRAAPTVSTGANDLALRAIETTTGTPAAPLDLSKVYDPAGQNTANCYVVNGPGHYKLPLVYGNAIRGGKPNTAAYTGASFVDHDNNPIASPYIAGAADATLVWMDSPGLVTNVRLVDDRHFLAFDLSPVSIVQGNAVVAVRNSAGVILWSWHIWVTPVAVFAAADPLAATFEMTGTNARYRVMNYNIGWVTSSGGRMFREHRATVRLRQVVSGRERDMLIVLKSGPTDATTGRNPYFQWGRKDPMPPAQGTSDTEVTIFGPPDLRLGYEGSIGSVSEAILHPNLFCTAPGIWPAGGATDLWDASDPALYDDNDVAFARTTSVKTVYDPSPAGFRVPVSDPFSALTTANFDWTPVYGYASRRYGASNQRFLPAAGRRITAEQLSDVNTHGYYWTSQGWIDGVSAKRLEFGDDDPSGGGEILDVTNGDFKAFGYSIRPVADADPVPLP